MLSGDEDAQMSGSRLGNLLSSQILTNTTPPRSPPSSKHSCQRSLSLSENISPTKSDVFSLKRPLLLSTHNVDATTPVSKKHKPLGAKDLNVVLPHERGTLFQYGFKRSPASSSFSNGGLPSPPTSITPEPISPTRATSPTSVSSEHSIKLGFQRSATEELIGDFSSPFALPLLSARDDLKTISCDTLAKLIRGEYSDVVSTYKIIDCRYPYEYDGGHIKGALNLYRQDQIMQELYTKQKEDSRKLQRKRSKQKLKQLNETAKASEGVEGVSSLDDGVTALGDIEGVSTLSESKSERLSQDKSAVSSPLKETPADDSDDSETEARNILVFHCEYSVERGPNLYRCLRREDRNGNPYPQLTYPELYLLDGGYKAFFSSFSHLCEPQSYKPMTHPEHTQDLRNFRSKSKSWAGKHHKKLSVRNLSRLGF